jgi:hypothetical protein
MDLHSWEKYDVDEYFIIFGNISPILAYAETDLDCYRLDLQTKLLNKLFKNDFSKDEMIAIYKSYMNVSNLEEKNLADVKKTLDNVYIISQEKCKTQKIKKIKDIMLSLDN